MNSEFLRDYALTRGFILGRPFRPQLTPDGQAVLYLQSPPRSPRMSLFEFEVATKSVRRLLAPEQLLGDAQEILSDAEKARRERLRISTAGFTQFELSPDGSRVLVSLSGKIYLFSRRDGRVLKLPTSDGTLIDPKFSPDGKSVSYVLDADIYVLNLERLEETQVTTGGTEELSHGLAEFVAQEEMGRLAGYWWAPDSEQIVYEEADARGVETWSAADPARPGETPHRQYYPRPGKPNVAVRLGTVSAAGGKTTWIDWDRERYPYLATVRWDKGGPLTLVVQSRLQQEMVLLVADTTTGRTNPLLIEKDPAWLNLNQQVPVWLADGSGFLWTSEQTGGPQLELRYPSGKLMRVLVGPESGYRIDRQDFPNIDMQGRQVYFLASDDPTQDHLWRVSLDGGKPVRLSEQTGQHSAVFAKNHSYYVQQIRTPLTMPGFTVYRASGEPIAQLPSAAEEPPFIPTTEYLKAGEGKGFYCSVTRPQDFDPQKRYPVIVDVYGGPGFVHVSATMQNRLLAQWRADQGFIVVAIDGRGTPGRGRDWERSIYGNFGQIPLEDQVSGLMALGKQYPQMDLERVGITGWSFGGYMSALAALRRPDVFKAAVAGALVADWRDYDTHYTERYLGLPEKNQAGYEASSLLTYTAGLERPLLLIHGTTDDNVFFLHTLKLSDALFKAGKQHEFLPLNGFTHMVPDPTVKERLEERIIQFFTRHLQASQP